MAFEDINRDAARLCELIERWQDGFPVSEIEKQLVLDKLKTLYERIYFMPVARQGDAGREQPAGVAADTLVSVQPVAAGCDENHLNEPEADSSEAFAASRKRPLDRALIQTLYEETAAEEPSLPAAPETGSGADDNTLMETVVIDFDPDDLVAATVPEPSEPAKMPERVGDRDAVPEADPEAQRIPGLPKEDEAAASSGKSGAPHPARVLGEVINAGCHTLGDAMQRNVRDDLGARIAYERIGDLHQAIGINDQFMFVRDLFQGDQARYRAAIDRLNAFDDLDDAMLYIHGEYDWKPDNEAARMLVELLCRKLL